MAKISKRGKLQIKKDESTYLEVWNTRVHTCEECGADLGDEFKDEFGRIQKHIYSHILTKGAFPEFRNNPENFNLLCLRHHQEWEFGNRDKMHINKQNQKTVDLLKSGVLNTDISRKLFKMKSKFRNIYSFDRGINMLSTILDVLDITEIDTVTRLANMVIENKFLPKNIETLNQNLDILVEKYSDRNLYD